MLEREVKGWTGDDGDVKEVGGGGEGGDGVGVGWCCEGKEG